MLSTPRQGILLQWHAVSQNLARRHNRILGVTSRPQADDAENPIAPANLLNALGGFDHFVFGDFEVCPFTPKRQGHMQMVCVERAENLVLKPYGTERKIGVKSPFHQ